MKTLAPLHNHPHLQHIVIVLLHVAVICILMLMGLARPLAGA